jgi:eukaryotic-like serine/threonine-protein kinase
MEESHLGRYEILEELGRGDMGIVYRAHDPLIDRYVAIKTIDLQKLSEQEKEEYKARFYQEAKAAGRLNHPNIITIYDLGRKGDIAYIAMELMEGPELQDIAAKDAPLSLIEKVDIAVQIAAGLGYAHEHGVIHRDIKPSNIMVLRGMHVKIADFGIARMESPLWRTQVDRIMGSPLYMSPEQVQSHPIGPGSDIFSFGIVFYQMLTGKLPFLGESANSVFYKIVNEEPPKPSALKSGIPEALDAIVAKCLAKKPEQRYQNARDLLTDLRACRRQLAPGDDSTADGEYFDGHRPGSPKISKNQIITIVVITALLSLAAYVMIEHMLIPKIPKLHK